MIQKSVLTCYEKESIKICKCSNKSKYKKVHFQIATGIGKVTALLSSICCYISSCIFRLKLATPKARYLKDTI